MNLLWTERGWKDYSHWQEFDPKMVARINEIIRDCMRHPYKGIGKPEPLRHELSGWWSRRISGEHRLVYRVVGSGSEQALHIGYCRFHYGR